MSVDPREVSEVVSGSFDRDIQDLGGSSLTSLTLWRTYNPLNTRSKTSAPLCAVLLSLSEVSGGLKDGRCRGVALPYAGIHASVVDSSMPARR